jgi:hypothetical protein
MLPGWLGAVAAEESLDDGLPKAHLQHVFTAIAVNIERLSGLPPNGEKPLPRPPTAFQDLLDQHEIPRPKSWRAATG